MKKAKLYLVPLLLFILVISQFSLAFAAPSLDEADSISGTVQKITAQTDPNTGETTVWVVLKDADGVEQTVHLSQAVALEWHMLVYENEKLVPNKAALGWDIEVPISQTLPDENTDTDELMHPVASALATFFSGIPGVDYDTLMSAHEDGYGFGVIAQALWLTQKLGGDAELLLAILDAKDSGDYSAFTLEDGTIPANWGEFRQAVMDGEKKLNLGAVMSSKDKDKDKKQDKDPDKGKPVDPGSGGNQGNNSNNGNANNPATAPDKGNNKDNGNKDNNGNGNPDKGSNKNKP